MIQVQLLVHGEKTFIEIPAGTTIEKINEYARFLDRANVGGYRVNGKPAQACQALQDQDRVSAVPNAGTLG